MHHRQSINAVLFIGLGITSFVSADTIVEQASPWKNPVEFNAKVNNAYQAAKRCVIEVRLHQVRTDQNTHCHFTRISQYFSNTIAHPEANPGKKWSGLPMVFRSPGLGEGTDLDSDFAATLDFSQKRSSDTEMSFHLSFTRGNMTFATLARITARRVDAGSGNYTCESETQVCENFRRENGNGPYICPGDRWETINNVVATINVRRHLFGTGGPREIDDIERLSLGRGRTVANFTEVVFSAN